ncbi:MAG: DUF86 domain-containing protein [Candidatus Pacebacteria bacterium]|nr:DUF86 domain-containing protein [Candidatus Paceibacterota bacterium]
MSNSKIIESKISEVKKYLLTVKKFQKYLQQEIENDETIKGAVERYLYLVCQATIDLAEAFISYRDLRKPTSQNDRFYILTENEIIVAPLSENMVKMTGFRNVLAHDYLKIDYKKVYDVLQNGLGDIEEFIKIIESKI